MSTPAARTRSPVVLRRVLAFADSGRGLACLFALGLGIRLVLAPRGGLQFDIDSFRAWAQRLAARGPGRFYAPGYFADYPPGYLYVLWALGKAARVLGDGSLPVFVLKLPAIAADLGIAGLAVRLAPRFPRSPGGAGFPVRAAAASAVLFNPALVLASAVWGQVDSVLALLVLAAVLVLAPGRPGWPREVAAVLLLAAAVATTPQAVFALPIAAVVLARRSLSGREPWSRVRHAAARLALLGGAGAAVVAALFAPFGIGPSEIPRFYRDAGSVYRVTSLWAFNLWGVVGFQRPDSGAGAFEVARVPAFHVGLALFAVLGAAVVARSLRTLRRGVEDHVVVLFGAVAMTAASYATLTRGHERYLYLAVAGLAPFVGVRRLRWLLALLSLLYLLDLHFVYVMFSKASSGHAWTVNVLYDAVFGTARDAWQRKALSGATLVACLATAGGGWRILERAASPARTPVKA